MVRGGVGSGATWRRWPVVMGVEDGGGEKMGRREGEDSRLRGRESWGLTIARRLFNFFLFGGIFFFWVLFD